MYRTKKKLIGLIVIVVLLVTSMPATLFALSGGETKTMKVGETCEIGIDHMWSSENPEIVNIEYRPCSAFKGATHDYAVAVAPGTAILKSKSMGTAVIKVIPKENREFKIYGYIRPDFQFPADKADVLKSGFRVELINTDRMATTNTDGYFEFEQVVPDSAGYYTVRIRKNGYLSRYITINSTNGDCEMSTIDEPIKMCAGDLCINSVQDNAVNMKDIMELATCFNSSNFKSDRYKYEYDLNIDGSINMADIMIMAQNFNKSSKDYPEVQVKYISASTVPTSTPIPTPTSTLIPTPTIPVPPTPTPTLTSKIYEVYLPVYATLGVSRDDGGPEGVTWEYEIENNNVVVLLSEYASELNDYLSIAPHTWNFRAIAEGTSYINLKASNGQVDRFLITTGYDKLTPPPTLVPSPTQIPPTPTPTRIPTPTCVQTFKPAPSPGTYELDLKVGDVCAIEFQEGGAQEITWGYKIENKNIALYDGESKVKISETDSGIDYKHTWYFKAIAEGTTRIVFHSNKGDLKFYRVIASKGTATVTPVPTPTPQL